MRVRGPDFEAYVIDPVTGEAAPIEEVVPVVYEGGYGYVDTADLVPSLAGRIIRLSYKDGSARFLLVFRGGIWPLGYAGDRGEVMAKLEEVAWTAWGAGFVDALILLRHALRGKAPGEILEKLDSMMLRAAMERVRRHLGEGALERILRSLDANEEGEV